MAEYGSVTSREPWPGGVRFTVRNGLNANIALSQKCQQGTRGGCTGMTFRANSGSLRAVLASKYAKLHLAPTRHHLFLKAILLKFNARTALDQEDIILGCYCLKKPGRPSGQIDLAFTPRSVTDQLVKGEHCVAIIVEGLELRNSATRHSSRVIEG